MAWVMDEHVWSGYFRRDDGSGGRVLTSRLEETTAKKRHLKRLASGPARPIEMKRDVERVYTVQTTDGWPFLTEEVVRNQTRLGGDASNSFTVRFPGYRADYVSRQMQLCHTNYCFKLSSLGHHN
jgi:hypothetical protein